MMTMENSGAKLTVTHEHALKTLANYHSVSPTDIVISDINFDDLMLRLLSDKNFMTLMARAVRGDFNKTNKLEFIKAVRDVTNVGLLESKEFVDSILGIL